jgi:hypothetical protein
VEDSDRTVVCHSITWSLLSVRHVALSGGQVQVLRLTVVETSLSFGLWQKTAAGLAVPSLRSREAAVAIFRDAGRGRPHTRVIAHALAPGRCRPTAQESCLSVMSTPMETSLSLGLRQKTAAALRASQ